jgi:universal stress protein E
MEKLISILIVLDQSSRDTPLLAKSLMLARQFGARVELFCCDAVFEYTLRHVYDERGLTEARQARTTHMREYLQQLCDQFAAQGVDSSIDAACESPLYEGVVHKILRSAPDLVVKAAALEPCEGRGALDVNDWQLIRACPVPLMLSRGGVWPPRPRFAVAVDVSEEETPGFAEMILRTAEYLRAGCRGELDILFGERLDIDGRTRQEHAATLRRLGREIQCAADRIQILLGDPATMVAAFGVRQHHDVLVLGALTHHSGLAALIGTLTGELMNTLTCDFLLIRPSGFVSPALDPIRAFSERPQTNGGRPESQGSQPDHRRTPQVQPDVLPR